MSVYNSKNFKFFRVNLKKINRINFGRTRENFIPSKFDLLIIIFFFLFALNYVLCRYRIYLGIIFFESIETVPFFEDIPASIPSFPYDFIQLRLYIFVKKNSVYVTNTKTVHSFYDTFVTELQTTVCNVIETRTVR